MTLYHGRMQAVFEVDKVQGLLLTELYEGVSVDDIRAATGAPFKVSTVCDNH